MNKKQLNKILKQREELGLLTNEQVLAKLEELEEVEGSVREYNELRTQVFLRYGREVLEAHTEYCEENGDITIKAFIELKGL